jgi:hypothetical protein
VCAFQGDWQSRNHEYNGLRFSGQNLIGPSLQVAKAAPDARVRDDPSTDFVADYDHLP